jgi:phage shock protein B
MDTVGAIAIIMSPIIIFMVIVAPIWVITHYISKSRRENILKSASISGEDQELLNRMMALLEKMEGRVGSLERILDVDDPRWRERRTVNERM